jgi:methyl-accepting chemotaxis protein
VKNLKLANKIFLLSISIIIVFSLTISWVYSRLKSSLYQSKQSAVQQLVESTWGIIDHFAEQQKIGLISEAQAKTAAIEAVRHTRFDGKNYFFISDTQSRIVLHPIKPKLEGRTFRRSEILTVNSYLSRWPM